MSELKLNTEAKEILLKGTQRLYDAVSITLGAKGQNVIIKSGFNEQPLITKDGVTVARNVASDNIMEQGGIDILLRAAEDTNSTAGDGTTTSIVLAHSLYKEGLKRLNKRGYLFNDKINSIEFKRGIDKYLQAVLDELDRIKITTFKTYDVANISANGDAEIAKLISDAFDLVGKDGIISIEASQSNESIIVKDDGMQLSSGIISPYLITDEKKGTASYKDLNVLIIDGEIEKPEYLNSYLLHSARTGTPLLVIAHEFTQPVINMFSAGKIKNGIQCLLLKAPFYGSKRSDLLHDISAMIGGEIITEKRGTLKGLGIRGNNIDDMVKSTEKFYGKLDKVKMNRTTSSLHFTANQEYIDTLKKQYEETQDIWIKERIAMLNGGVATIHVGGYSSTEVRERLDRVEDAVNATRASLVNGVVAGGGIALLEARKVIKNLKFDSKAELEGAKTLYYVLGMPSNKILENAELPIKEYGKYPNWIDIRTLEQCNMLERGIIDPVNVTKTSLTNAISVASTLLTSGGYVLVIK